MSNKKLSFKILKVYLLPDTHQLLVQYQVLEGDQPIVNLNTIDGFYTMIHVVNTMPTMKHVLYLLGVHHNEGTFKSVLFKRALNEHLVCTYSYYRNDKNLVVSSALPIVNHINHCKNLMIEMLDDKYIIHHDVVRYSNTLAKTETVQVVSEKPPSIIDIYNSLYKYL